MKLTKRILCLALALAMVASLAACGKKKPADTDKGGNTTTTTTTAADDWGDDVFNDAELDWG